MKILGVVASLIAIVGGALGILAYFKDPGVPDENQAQLFLDGYYEAATKDPALAWSMTTDSYRAQEFIGGYEGYASYWGSMPAATVDDFGISQDPQWTSWWKARITFIDEAGKTTRPYFQYELECEWHSNLPWNSCDRERILLNKARQYDPKEYAEPSR